MATTYIAGTTIKAKAEFRNSSNVLIDPTSVTLKYKKPDDSIVTKTTGALEITKTSVGIYEIYLTLDLAGKYSFRWEGAGIDGSVSETQLTVTASKVI